MPQYKIAYVVGSAKLDLGDARLNMADVKLKLDELGIEYTCNEHFPSAVFISQEGITLCLFSTGSVTVKGTFTKGKLYKLLNFLESKVAKFCID